MNIHEGEDITGHQDLLINKEAHMDIFSSKPFPKI